MSATTSSTTDGHPHTADCVREPADWCACEPGTFVRHLPTGAMFEFYPLPHKQGDDVLALEDFRARLVHVCEGHPAPAPAEHTRLCREAVLMGLHFLGMVTLTEVPDGRQQESGDGIPF